MRYIAYGLAILAALLTVAYATGYLSLVSLCDAVASRGTMNVLQME
jgi:hypothetical protein